MDKATEADFGLIRGILIDPTDKTVQSVLIHPGTTAKAIGCEYITCVTISEGNGKWSGYGEDLWLDDEGLLVQPNPYGYFRLVSEIDGSVTPMYAGRGLILGFDNDGESVSTKLSIADVFPTVEWIDFKDAIPEELEPAMTVTPLDEHLQPIPGKTTRHPLSVRKPPTTH